MVAPSKLFSQKTRIAASIAWSSSKLRGRAFVACSIRQSSRFLNSTQSRVEKVQRFLHPSHVQHSCTLRLNSSSSAVLSSTQKKNRAIELQKRDLRPSGCCVVACPTCGAAPGVWCWQQTGPGSRTSTDKFGLISDPLSLPPVDLRPKLLPLMGDQDKGGCPYRNQTGLTTATGHIILVILAGDPSCEKWPPHNSRLNVSP